jgi:glycosyltransferase involved in cell wall biosynthesis
MKISVIISACDKRIHLFTRSLDTWVSQSMPKNDFEIIVIDDAIREDLRALCQTRSQSDGLNIQFIRIDKTKSVIPIKSFIPVLTNNVGFRHARGEVVVITGPETLQASSNLDIAWTLRDRKECAYGLVFRASWGCTNYIAGGWNKIKSLPMAHLLQIPGAKEVCVTMLPHPPAYWYLMAVAKKHVDNIGGVDERFLGGICAEDDDFANRMRMSGIQPVFEHKMIGLHQDHSKEDLNDGIHINRREGLGYHLWVHNFSLLQDNLAKGDPVANVGFEWGSPNLITLHEYFGVK